MKNIFLTIVLILTATVSKAQNIIVLNVDESYLFEYSDTLSFEDAWSLGLVNNLETVRRYDESFKNWVIDMTSRQITFGTYQSREIIKIESDNNKLVYKNGLGQTCKLFMMSDVDTGQEMVFFLEEPKDGKVKGGFAYPTTVK